MNRQAIREKLPHGGVGEVGRRAGVSLVTVSLWFSGKNNSEKVEAAALEVLAEVQAKRQQTQVKFEAALRGEKL